MAGSDMLLLTNKDTSATHPGALTFAPSQHGARTLYGFDAANGVHAIASDSNPDAALALDNLPALFGQPARPVRRRRTFS